MLQEITRPLSEAERRLLRRRATIPKQGSVYWMRNEPRAALITACVCAGILLLGFLMHFPILGAVVAITFALMRFIRYRARRRLRGYMMANTQRFTEELDAGQARSIICQPIRIIEREEFEDEGAFWIFDGGDGRYLALVGQEYYETPRFPSPDFEIVMGARHGSIIGIRSRGLRVPSTLIVKGDDVPWGTFPKEDVTVFTAPPNADLPALLRGLINKTAAKD